MSRPSPASGLGSASLLGAAAVASAHEQEALAWPASAEDATATVAHGDLAVLLEHLTHGSDVLTLAPGEGDLVAPGTEGTFAGFPLGSDARPVGVIGGGRPGAYGCLSGDRAWLG